MELLRTNWSDSQVSCSVSLPTLHCAYIPFILQHMCQKVNRPTYFQQFSCPLLFPPVHVVGSENVPFLKWDLWMFYLTKNYLFRDQWRHKSAGISNFCITVLLVANIRINFCVHRLKIHSMENQPITSPAMERHIWVKVQILSWCLFPKRKCSGFAITGNYKSREASRTMSCNSDFCLR